MSVLSGSEAWVILELFWGVGWLLRVNSEGSLSSLRCDGLFSGWAKLPVWWVVVGGMLWRSWVGGLMRRVLW